MVAPEPCKHAILHDDERSGLLGIRRRCLVSAAPLARISYTCPRKWFGPNSHIGSIKFYIAGENLFVLTRYSGYDPEVYSNQGSSSMSNILTSGFDYGCFPRPRTFTAGINILFQ